uniref:NADH-ubiquinone oxidoreductase chain 5 n=1 Tax=Metacrangonyx sp. 1 MDMBR-2012 TaxID=1200660 RepID=K7ZVR9_9CRUS|nr:NADH dehydrogenase subunit 5 [Metacrangonyx sp. 1 MDMBR-2012]
MKIDKWIYFTYMFIMLSMSIFSLSLFMFLMMNNKSFFFEWEIYFFNGCSMIFVIMLDSISTIFMFTVGLISAVICAYCSYYMEGDRFYKRFMIILMLFVSSMMLLILSPNLISLLLGWDGLGLSSYILVIYYQNEYACNSGMLTVLSNRIGDAMILISVCLMYCNNSWNFLLENTTSKVLLILLIISAMTKSAQVPFSAWLPAAMAAPTPVSALVHSSTLVTAGVFLLIRFYPCFYESSIFTFLLISSSITMVLSGWMANFEMDMKKIIALSTLSQLGLMMMSVSSGMPELAFFHLIIHAMFKSTIFMCAGIMIHNMTGSQDLRLSNNFFISGPLLGLFFAISNMSLCGFPYLAGFFSKDLLLENILSYNMNFFFRLMTMIGTGLTISYSLRVMYFMSSKSVKAIMSDLNEMKYFLFKTMAVMLFMSVSSGFLLSWMYLPSKVLFINLTSASKLSVMGVMIISFLLSYIYGESTTMPFNYKVSLLSKGNYLMMFLPFLSSQMLSTTPLKESLTSSVYIESGWLEYILGHHLYTSFSMLNYKFMFMQVTKFLKVLLVTMLTVIFILMNFS